VTAFAGRARRGPIGIPTRVTGTADFHRRFGPLTRDSTLGYAIRHYFANGGREAIVLRVTGTPMRGHEADLIGSEAAGTGIHALRTAPHFSLLVLPPPTRTTDHSPAVWNAAARLCEDVRALLLVDAPASWSTPPVAHEDLQDPKIPLDRTSAAAVYFPRLLMPDPLSDDAPAPFAPSPAVAGVMARLDAARGIWKAPAGLDASIVPPVAPVAPLSRDDDDRLTLLGVNSIRTFDGRGTLIWGARTWDLPGSDWRYVNVRRLGFHLEASIAHGLRWVVFEPNDEPLWLRVRMEVDTYLHRFWRNGAFPGLKPQEAYVVRCGLGVTMTQADLDAGRLVVEVAVAPVKPAEFVVIRLGWWTADAASAATGG
jgi:uncharacterized protein